MCQEPRYLGGGAPVNLVGIELTCVRVRVRRRLRAAHSVAVPLVLSGVRVPTSVADDWPQLTEMEKP